MKYTAEQLGLESWLSLYNDLVKQGLHESERIALEYPAEQPDETDATSDLEIPKTLSKPADVILQLSYIRSRAFLEVYEQLPSKESIQVLIDVLNDPAMPNQATPIIEFLNKIPTR